MRGRGDIVFSSYDVTRWVGYIHIHHSLHNFPRRLLYTSMESNLSWSNTALLRLISKQHEHQQELREDDEQTVFW
jgi:hypothetical protein